MRSVLVSVALLIGACAPRSAIVRGREMPRVTANYTDSPRYTLTHYAAYPEARGPSSGVRDYAGRVAGRVCRTQVWLEADYRGRHMDVAGYYEPIDGGEHTINQIQLQVRDYSGERHILGTIGAGQEPIIGWAGVLAGPAPHPNGRAMADYAFNEPDHVVDLSYNSGRLYGSLNGQRFALGAAGNDTFVGTVSTGGTARPFVFRHLSRIWAMPVADQAAILPMLLSCDLDNWTRMPVGGTLNLTSTMKRGS